MSFFRGESSKKKALQETENTENEQSLSVSVPTKKKN